MLVDKHASASVGAHLSWRVQSSDTITLLYMSDTFYVAAPASRKILIILRYVGIARRISYFITYG